MQVLVVDLAEKEMKTDRLPVQPRSDAGLPDISLPVSVANICEHERMRREINSVSLKLSESKYQLFEIK